MVAVVTGNGLGLFNVSSNILGSAAGLGLGSLGQAGGRALVNAATGNLILRGLDEQLSGRGADLNLLRTYNSRGTVEDDLDVDGNGWRWDGERTVKFSGAADQRNVSGTVTRTAGDGHVTIYAWDPATLAYLSTDGDGAHDSVKYEGGLINQWVWTDGSSRLEERYGNSVSGSIGRLVSQTDVSGNKITFTHDEPSGRLTEVVDFGSGQKLKLVYSTTGPVRLERVETFELNVDANGKVIDPPTVGATPIRQVEYFYDNGRIGTVKTILNPGGGTPTYFSTTYTYLNATSSLITNVAQSDGFSVSFTYYTDADGADAGKLESVTDANGKQTFTYKTNSTDVTVSDSDGSNAQTWTYAYDAVTRQLTQIESPAPAEGGARLVTRFEYETEADGAGHAGNVKKIIDARGNEVVYEYDDRGNRILERDAEGNTLTRTYNGNNQVLTETRYKVKDPDGAGAGQASEPMTTRFVYDSSSRLRFVISAEGRVSESRYGAGISDAGLLTRTVQYAGARYSSTTVSESELATWVANLTDKTQAQQTQYEYDFRGNLAKRTDFARLDAVTGNGVLDAAATVTEYVYSGYGELLQTIAVRDQRTILTSISYDGMGRELTRNDASGLQTTSYDDVNHKIQVITATGLTVVSSFDSVGRLTSVTKAAGDASRQTQYIYDTFGRLRLVQDPQGGRRFSFYDAVGRLQYQVDSTGAVTGFEYNATGQLIKQTRYANAATDIGSWVDDAMQVTKHSLTVGAAGSDVEVKATHDRVSSLVYDNAGRLTTRTDAANTVITTIYDGASRITTQQSGNRVTRYFYDRDGKQVGVVDPLGYLTEHKFDAAGRLVESVRYSTRSPSAGNVAPPVWVGITDQTAVGGRGFTYRMPAFDADGDDLIFSVVGAQPAWLTVTTDAHGVTLSGTPPKTLTNYALTLSASDQRGQSAEVTVTIKVANTVPKWEELSNSRVAVNTPGYSLTLPAASDNESGTLTYSINAALLPPGLTFNAGTRTISGVPTTPGTYSIIARVTDGQGLFTEQTFTVTVTNKGPSWPALDDDHRFPPARLNVPYSAPVPAALEPDGEALTYSAILIPSWLHFDPVTRILSGTPPQFGAFHVVLEARDPHGKLAQLSFTVTVVNSVPTWTQLPPINAMAGSTIDHPIPAAVDPDGEALTYTVVSGLPPGLSVNAATGRISGISNAVGPFHLMLLATDPRGGSVQSSVSIQLHNALPVYHGGIPATQTVVGGDGPQVHIPVGMFTDANDTLSFTISATRNGNNVPSWLHLENRAGGNRVFTGTAPVSVSTRNYRFTITASDPHGGSVIATFEIEVLPPHDDQLVSGDATDAVAEPPVAQVALPPIEDVLSLLRPTTSASDLHSYQYYDAQGRLVGSVDERGFLSEIVYDEQANTQKSVRYETAVTVAAAATLDELKGEAGVAKTSTTEYDSLGRVSKRIGVDGTVTRNEYDNAGRLVREVRADATSEARGSRIRYNAFGEITGTVSGEGDAAGLSTDAAIAQYGLGSEYDSLGRRTRTIDANGNGTLFYYDREGRLNYTVNARGEVSENLYNAFGQLQSTRRYFTRLPEGVLATLQASGGGLANETLLSALAAHSILDKDQLTNYEYNTRGLLEKSTDAEGFTTTHTYSAFGELETQVRTIVQAEDSVAARTVTTQFDYDLRGQLLSQTADVSGLNFNTQSAYDAFGRVIESIDGAGKVTSTSYLDSGRTIEVTDALNRKMRTEYDAFARVLTVIDARQQSTTYFYDDVARSLLITTPEGVTVTTTRTRHGQTLTVLDGRGKTTLYDYNKDGQLKKVTDGLGHVVSENTYDESGLLIETKDARGIVTRLSYDEINRLFVRRVDPAGLNLVTTYQVTAFGQMLTQTEGVGNNQGDNVTRVTRYKYDRKGQLTQVIADPDVEQTGYVGMNLTTTYSYDGVGNTIKVKRGTVDSPNQQVTLYEFDKLNRRVKEIAAPSAAFGAGSPRTRDLTTEYRYDSAGRVSRRIDANGANTWFVYDAAGQQTQVINALGEVSESFYDENGRVVRTHRYFERVSATVLAGLGDVASAVTLAAKQDDQRKYIVYDNDGRQRYTLQNTQGLNWVISENRYDGNGNLIEARRYDKVLADARVTAISAGGITPAEVASELTTLGYTEADNTLSLIQRTRHAYDAANRLRFTVDALGSVSERVYDKAGNLVSQVRYEKRPTLGTFTDSAINSAVDRSNAKNQVSHFIYDAAGRQRYSVQVAGTNAQGALTHRVIRQTYDAVGRVVRTDAYATAMTLADYTQATLDAAIALSGNKSAHDRTSAFAYDEAGRQVYSVQVAGSVAGEARHVVTQRVYDALGQLVRSTTYANTMALSDYRFETLDTVVGLSGNQSAQDRTTAFAYDEAGRQVYIARVAGFNEAGDALHVVTQQVYNALSQVITSTTYAKMMTLADYAQATLDAVLSDEENQSAQDRTTAFAYDVMSRQRFVVAADGSLSETVYNRLGQVGERLQFDLRVSLPTPTTRYKEAELSTARGARAVGDDVTRVEKYVYDRAGQLLATTDANGFIERYSYDAFGNRRDYLDKNGNEWNYTHDLLGRLSTQVTPKVLVRLGAETVERSLTTLMEYDALDNLVTRTEASGTVDARATSYGYDPLGRQTLITQPGHYVPASDVPGSGTVVKVAVGVTPPAGSFQRTLETSYDALGAVRTRLRTGADSYQFEYKTYDSLGRIVHDVDALNHVTTFGYNAFSDQASVTRHSVSVSGAPANGAFWNAGEIADKMVGDARARTITTSYDHFGHKAEVRQPPVIYFEPNALPAQAITKYEYTAFGEMRHEAVKIDAFGGPDGHWRETWHYFDLGGRENRTIDAQGYHTARSYDASGNVIETREYATAGALGGSSDLAPATPSTHLKDRITAFTYDGRNQQLTIERKGLFFTSVNDGVYVEEFADSKVMSRTSYDGSGHVLSRTDALNGLTSMQYDASGHLQLLTEPERETAGAGSDPFLILNRGRLKPATSFTRNAYGQIVSQTRSGLTTTLKYDFAGNLISSTDARGSETQSEYDFGGRLTRQTRHIDAALGSWTNPNGTPGTWQTVDHTLDRRFMYDTSGRQSDVVEVYYTAAGVQQQIRQHTQYNTFGEMTEQSKHWNAPADDTDHAIVATYGYDDAGHRTGTLTGDGLTKYFYDMAGQVVQVEQSGLDNVGVRHTRYAYDAFGRLTLQRLPFFIATVGPDSRSVTPAIEQAFDRWGNVVSRSQGAYFTPASTQLVTNERRTTTYEYNHDNQVIAEHLPVVQAWRADGTAYQVNMTHKVNYDLAGRALQEIEVADDAATAANEALRLRTRSKEYDEAGQLVSQTDAMLYTTRYAYDVHGNRVGTLNALGTVFVDEFDANGNITQHSVLRLADGRSAYVSGSGQTAVARVLTRFQYDQANRRVGSAQVMDDPRIEVWTYTQYDERNHVRQELRIIIGPFSSALGDVLTGRLTRTCEYDAHGKISEKDANNNEQTWRYNTADYAVGRLAVTALGADTTRITTYRYNGFGQVEAELTSGGIAVAPNNRSYEYHSNGLLKRVVDGVTFGTFGVTGGTDYWKATDITAYEYNVNGERVQETYQRSGEREILDPERNVHEMTVLDPISRLTQMSYDALGRAVTVSAPAALNLGRSGLFLIYSYDELGNRRNIDAGFQRVGDSFTQRSHWYDYDAEGRMTIVDGVLKDGRVQAYRGIGTQITYDELGRRETAESYEGHKRYTDEADRPGETFTWHQYHKEFYSYDDLGYLKQIEQRLTRRERENTRVTGGEATKTHPGDLSGVKILSETRHYNLRGDMEARTLYSRVEALDDTTDRSRELASTASLAYRTDGLLDSHLVIDHLLSSRNSKTNYHYDLAGVRLSYIYEKGVGGQDSFFRDSYVYHYTMEFGGYKEKSITVTSSRAGFSGETINQYDSRGQLREQRISSGDERRIKSFSYDSEGHIVSKSELLAVSRQGTTPGEQDYYYANGRQAAALGVGTLNTVQFGNDYMPISATYPNTTPGTHVINTGDSLAGIAQAVYGDAQLWYLIADANSVGFDPTQSMPDTEVGKTYRIPNVVGSTRNNAATFAPYDAARIIGDSTPMAGLPSGPVCSSSEQHLAAFVIIAVVLVVSMVTGGAATAALGNGAFAMVAGAGVGAAAGSAAGQGTAIGLKVQQDFSIRQVVGAGVGAALGSFATLATSTLGTGLLGRVTSTLAQAAAQTTATLISGGDLGPRNALGVGTDVLVNGFLGGYYDTANTKDFGFGSALRQITADAVNPHSGWLFNDDERTWAHLATQALTVGKIVLTGGVEEKRPNSKSNVIATRTDFKSDGQPEQSATFISTGDIPLSGDLAGDFESVEDLVRQGLADQVRQDKLRAFAEESDEWLFDAETGTLLREEIINVESSAPVASKNSSAVVPASTAPRDSSDDSNAAASNAPTHLLGFWSALRARFHAPSVPAEPPLRMSPYPTSFPPENAVRRGYAVGYKFEPLSTLTASHDAYMFDAMVRAAQIADTLEVIARRPDIHTIHTKINAHGTVTGTTQSDPKLISIFDKIFDDFEKAHPDKKLIGYDPAVPDMLRAFGRVHEATGRGGLAGHASLNTACFGVNQVPYRADAHDAYMGRTASEPWDGPKPGFSDDGPATPANRSLSKDVLGVAGRIYSAASGVATLFTVLDQVAKGDGKGALTTVGTTGGFMLAAKYGPAAIARNLPVLGTAAFAIADVYQHTDQYVEDSVNWVRGSGLNPSDNRYWGTALAIGYTTGVSVGKLVVEPVKPFFIAGSAGGSFQTSLPSHLKK